MKLTPMKAEEATARSAPVRLAAKRSPPAFGGAGVIDGARGRRREADGFGAGPGPDLEMEAEIGFLDFSCLKFGSLENALVVPGVRGRSCLVSPRENSDILTANYGIK